MRDDPIAADMVERVAKAIYDTMREYDAEGARYPWVERGNSDNQDKARRRARAALEGAEGIFVCPACDRQQHEPVSIRGCYHCGHGNPIPRAYAGRDDVAEAHDDVIDAEAPAVAEADVRRALVAFMDWPEGTRVHDRDPGLQEWRAQLRRALAADRAARATPAEGAEVARLKRVIERDRTAYCAIVNALRKEIQSRRLISQSRGPYEWDDDEYMKEFGRALDAFSRKLDAMERQTHMADWSDSPTSDAEIQRARREPPAGAPERPFAACPVLGDTGLDPLPPP